MAKFAADPRLCNYREPWPANNMSQKLRLGSAYTTPERAWFIGRSIRETPSTSGRAIFGREFRRDTTVHQVGLRPIIFFFFLRIGHLSKTGGFLCFFFKIVFANLETDYKFDKLNQFKVDKPNMPRALFPLPEAISSAPLVPPMAVFYASGTFPSWPAPLAPPYGGFYASGTFPSCPQAISSAPPLMPRALFPLGRRQFLPPGGDSF